MPSPLSPLVSRVAEGVAAEGIRSVVVGRAAWASRRGAAAPAEATLVCEASSQRLHQLPGGICLGRGHGVRVNFPDGSVLLLPGGADLEAGLAAAPWTVLAFGVDPSQGDWLDPCGGAADWDGMRLHPCGPAGFALDALAAVAAIRLACEQGLQLSQEARVSLSGSAARCAEPGGAPVRHELEALLLGPETRRGLELLRATGIEAQLVPGSSPFAAQWVADSAAHRTARWSAWLIGAKASRVLPRLRMPRDRARAIEARLAYGRTEQAIAPREASVRRAVARLGSPEAVHEVVDLRRRELEASGEFSPEIRTRLEAIIELLDAPVGPRLVWTGRDVMKSLELPAGPQVGLALSFLRERVAQDPSGNHPTQLRRWLNEWAESAGSDPVAAPVRHGAETLDPASRRE